VFVIELPRQA